MRLTMAIRFEQGHIDSIARALATGSEDEALTGSEIGHLLTVCRMGEYDPGTGITKWKRVQAAFASKQNHSLAMARPAVFYRFDVVTLFITQRLARSCVIEIE